MKTPVMQVERHGRTLPMRARTASPEERAKLWPAVLAASRRYGDYQRNTEREIPLVICEPRLARGYSETPIER